MSSNNKGILQVFEMAEEALLVGAEDLRDSDYVINDPRWWGIAGRENYENVRGLDTREIDNEEAQRIKDTFEQQQHQQDEEERGNSEKKGRCHPKLLKREQRRGINNNHQHYYYYVYKFAELIDICREVNNEMPYDEDTNVKEYDLLLNHPRRADKCGHERWEEVKVKKRSSVSLVGAKNLRDKFQQPVFMAQEGEVVKPVIWRRHKRIDDQGKIHYVVKVATLEEIRTNIKGTGNKSKGTGMKRKRLNVDDDDGDSENMTVATAAITEYSTTCDDDEDDDDDNENNNDRGEHQPVVTETLRSFINGYHTLSELFEGNEIIREKELSDFRKSLDAFLTVPYSDKVQTDDDDSKIAAIGDAAILESSSTL